MVPFVLKAVIMLEEHVIVDVLKDASVLLDWWSTALENAFNLEIVQVGFYDAHMLVPWYLRRSKGSTMV